MEDSRYTEESPKSRTRFYAAVLGAVVVIGGFAYVLTTNAEPASGQEAEEVAEADATDEADAKDEKAPIPVRATALETGAIASYITATANLVPEDQVRLLAETEGRVAQVKVEEGDTVAKGDVLAILDQGEAKILLGKARIQAENAEQELARAEEVFAQELLSREALDELSTAARVARHEVEEAEWRVEKTVIRAPFAGLVTDRMITLGQNVRLGDELFGLADFDPLVARIFLAEQDVIGLETGRDVALTLGASDDVKFDGRVLRISPVVDTATGTVKVTIEAVDPPTAVRPGAFVSVDIVRERHPDALLLPRESVVRELARSHVFVADGDAAARREVTLGIEEGGFVEALSGLEVGDRVIVAGQGGLKDGSKIRVLEPNQES